MKRINLSLLHAAFRVAKSAKAKAIFVSLDCLNEVPEEEAPKGTSLVLITRRRNDELEGIVKEGGKLSPPVLHLPKVDMTRMGQVKMSMVLALSNRLIHFGDKVVLVTGDPGKDQLDSIFLLDTGKESEILTTQGVTNLAEGVTPEVFEEALEITLELAARGREGKPIGTVFVLGDEDKVMQLSRQLIINPFKGYSDEERNILNPEIKETLREFAAIDGAFVISRDGLVLSAGRYLGAATDMADIPRGLGARHMAAAGITSMTQAIAFVISESTGDVRIFKNGKILMEIEKPIRSSNTN